MKGRAFQQHPARLAALRAGEPSFDIGPCCHGHKSARAVNNGQCIMCRTIIQNRARGRRPKGLGAIIPRTQGPRRNGVITHSQGEYGAWRVRCDDGTEVRIEVGDVRPFQSEKLPLMVVGAEIEFVLRGEDAFEVEPVAWGS